MLEESFVFSKKSNIILYGAASIGHLMFTRFSDAGYTVIGFIDKRADEIKEYLGVPVWSVSSVPEKIKQEERTVVFLAVKNVFEHQTIAARLIENGFYHIIYKPYNSIINNPSEYDQKMSATYDQIFGGMLEGEKKIDATVEVPGVCGRDYGICRQDDDYVTALIPVDFIFTNDYQNTEMEKWGNINILAFFTHLQFYNFLQGDREANYTDYLNEYCVFTAVMDGKIKITDEWKNNVLHNRVQIYDEMCRALLLDHEFFYRVPPQAVWNAKGYFNLVSGKHRATFLAAKQHYMIPLKITREDYSSFLNMDCFEEVKKYLSKESAGNAYVPHPYCYRLSGISYTYYGMLSVMVRLLAKKTYGENGRIRFDKLEILDDSGDNGVLGAYFARMGSRVIRINRTQKENLPEAVWKLGHVSGKIKEVNELPQVIHTDVLIVNLRNESMAAEDIEQIHFQDGFVICREERQVHQWAQKHHVKNVLKIFNTFLEDGVSLLYWLY